MQGQGKVTRASDKTTEVQWDKCAISGGQVGQRVYLHFPSQGFYHGIIVSLECDANAIEISYEEMYEAGGEVWRERKYETVSITRHR